MKIIKYITTIFFLIFSISLSYSQTADEIIDKYISAMGGLDKINSFQTVKFTVKFSAMGMDIPSTMIVERPDKIRVESSMQGQSMVQACDGTTAWQINPFMGSNDPEKMNEENTKGMKDQAHFEGKLVNYKDKGSTVEFLGKEDMDGSDVYKLKLVDKDSAITTYYIDATSYLLIKEIDKQKFKEKEITQTTTMGNYKSEDGYLLPHSIESTSDMGPMGNSKITIEKVEFNIPVDESIFKFPESK